MIYDFYIYCGKDDAELEFKDLQKCSHVVAKLSKHIHNKGEHKLYFGNWFTTLPLLHFLKSKQVCAVGTIRAIRLADCPLAANKDLERQGRGALDYMVDSNSGIITTEWVDNKTVQVASNYTGIEPMGTINQWSKASNAYENISCSRIILGCSKSMGRIDLVDMLIALYRIKIKTKRWYIKIFWYMADICKLNAWNLYRRHFIQYGDPVNKMESFLSFSFDIANALINAYKLVVKFGRPSKRSSIDKSAAGPSKKAAVATPCNDIRYDQVNHWPEAVEKKQWCQFCQVYSRIKCSKCQVSLCLLKEKNCFGNFHVKHIDFTVTFVSYFER